EKNEKQIGRLDFTLGDLLTPGTWLRQGPRTGAALTTRNLDFDDLSIDREVRKLVATKTSVAEGVKVTYQEVEVTMPKEGSTGLEIGAPSIRHAQLLGHLHLQARQSSWERRQGQGRRHRGQPRRDVHLPHPASQDPRSGQAGRG